MTGVSDPAGVCSGGRIALSGLAARNELRVVADCRYSSTGAGLHRAVDSADGKVYLYTNFEPADARRVFANFEQPDLKAEFAFHVTAPAHWTVLSNQPAPEPEPVIPAAPDGEPAAVWHFPPTPRISTYVTAVAAGEYHLVRESHTTPGGQVVPLALGRRASLAAHLDPGEIFHQCVELGRRIAVERHLVVVGEFGEHDRAGFADIQCVLNQGIRIHIGFVDLALGPVFA